MVKKRLTYLFKCMEGGSANNGLKNDCNFEMEFEEGTHHCPICGKLLELVSDGPSVSELLRRGEALAQRRRQKNNEDKK